MGFWTSQKLKRTLEQHPAGLPSLISLPNDTPLGTPISASRVDSGVDCNAFTLTIGDEVYISPSESVDKAPGKSILQLKERESFTIPAGQFGFLTTEEVVCVPKNAMAFISIKSTHKFKGLINVSGFHVDPGFHGQLVFSVFNAGPQPITLRRGQDAFLIWFSDLSDTDISPETQKRKEEKRPSRGLDANKLNGIAGEVHSFKGLLARMQEGEKKIQDRLNTIEREQAVIKWASAIIIGIIAGYIGWVVRK